MDGRVGLYDSSDDEKEAGHWAWGGARVSCWNSRRFSAERSRKEGRREYVTSLRVAVRFPAGVVEVRGCWRALVSVVARKV
jgi:hypothetical protein